MSKLLDQIKKENDIKKIAPEQYPELAAEIRGKLVRSVSKTGGHLASNLGAVELTMALHIYLDFPKDKLVWDVGHQAYVHKLLTGRKEAFDSLRQMGGLSGFPKIKENPSDTFNTGHSSTSISVALGLAKARDLKHTKEKVFAVIGDGALTGGMAFEALNNAAQLQSNMVIVLNDNKMSIAPNVGGMSNYLGRIRTNEKYRKLKVDVENALDRIPNFGEPIVKHIKKAKDSLKHLFIPGMLFEDMGLTYIGPVDGHNVQDLLTAFSMASQISDKPVLVHVLTKKGKGYRPAEARPDIFHGVGKYDVQSGLTLEKEELTYTKLFGQWMVQIAEKDREIVSICAAMPDGTGLRPFSQKFPSRFFDVGIAEEHAVTFAAGLAAGGLKPIVSLYSTFLQRAYDQILHDVCLSNLPVVFTVDRSGIVGRDGETHQGIYDISFLSSIPGMTIVSPMDGEELVEALNYATMEHHGPIAIRYPRGKVFLYEGERTPFCHGKAQCIKRGQQVVIFAVGNMVERAIAVSELLQDVDIHPTIVNMRFVKPLDTKIVDEMMSEHSVVVTMEDNIYSGGFSQQLLAYMESMDYHKTTLKVCFPDTYVEHGDPEELYEKYGMSPETIAEKIERMIS